MLKTLRTTIEGLKNAFKLFVVTLHELKAALETNSATVAKNTEAHSQLSKQLATIAENSGYLVRAKRAELSRQGHSHNI